jgi:hypothetical protein
MPFIIVDPETLDVHISDTPSDTAFCVSTDRPDAPVIQRPPLEQLLYFDVLYGAVEEKATRLDVRLKLPEPDPWLLAVAYTMWQGLVQGLTWEIVKQIAVKAIDRMRTRGVAPSDLPGSSATQSDLELGFSWASYGRNGRKLHELFLGLRRHYRSRSEDDRARVADPLQRREYSDPVRHRTWRGP